MARQDTGIALPPGELAFHEPYLAAARSRLGDAAREEAEPPTIFLLRQRPADGLTAREREVVVLVASGLTNRRISTTPGISERTAGNHVGRILGKLGLRSRAQIATWAAEQDLLTSDLDRASRPPARSRSKPLLRDDFEHG